MVVSLIGSNGLLSSSIGMYCNRNAIPLNVYGRTEPEFHSFTKFVKIDLLNEALDYKEIGASDLIIYTVGGGIQFHLKEDTDTVYYLNVTIPLLISNHLKEIGYQGKMVTFGSYFEIGENNIDRSFDENELLQSQLLAPNDYAVSKRMLSRFFSSFQSSFTYWHFILPTIYGEHESNYRLIPYTLKSISENTNLKLTSGEQVRQYIYTCDVANVIFNSIESELMSGIYNIEGVEEFSVRELVTLLFNLYGQDVPEDVFGKTERVDVGMKILRLNGQKLLNNISFRPATRIFEVYKKYRIEERREK